MSETYEDYYEKSLTKSQINSAIDKLLAIRDALRDFMEVFVDSSGNIISEYKERLDEIETAVCSYIDDIEDIDRLFIANAKEKGDVTLSYWKAKAAENAVDHYSFYDSGGEKISASNQAIVIKSPTPNMPIKFSGGEYIPPTGMNGLSIEGEYKATKGITKIASACISAANGYVEVKTIEEVVTYDYKTQNGVIPNCNTVCANGTPGESTCREGETMYFNFENHIV